MTQVDLETLFVKIRIEIFINLMEIRTIWTKILIAHCGNDHRSQQLGHKLVISELFVNNALLVREKLSLSYVLGE